MEAPEWDGFVVKKLQAFYTTLNSFFFEFAFILFIIFV